MSAELLCSPDLPSNCDACYFECAQKEFNTLAGLEELPGRHVRASGRPSCPGDQQGPRWAPKLAPGGRPVQSHTAVTRSTAQPDSLLATTHRPLGLAADC